MIVDIHIGDQPVKVDLDRLTPTARALAEAVADHPARSTVDIWMEADAPIRDTTPDWHLWYTEAEAARPERRPWRGWSTKPLNGTGPHERLEDEAAKIPPGWHVLGAHPARPVPSGPVREATSAQVLTYLREHGRDITAATWSSYVARNQAPQPVRKVGRTPLWDLDEVERWHAR
ncbi:hypothetical protein Drose_05915 [Dactylosporangium roseum]|uniref:Uncharacterized protein n=1 Tax=Dactylosporangium roseum TaxID=47989 RepID=A0ABY5Z8L3_9ACTN|nr:hypothetical protein [Dactylosporangium roseum]UWZ37807.1 hypothetical protein Drose_05915 [Dactylosporangium roseum]